MGKINVLWIAQLEERETVMAIYRNTYVRLRNLNVAGSSPAPERIFNEIYVFLLARLEKPASAVAV